jgi:hypothetical protein
MDNKPLQAHIVRHKANGHVVIRTTAPTISVCVSSDVNEHLPGAYNVTAGWVDEVRRGLASATDDGERVLETSQANVMRAWTRILHREGGKDAAIE